MDWQSAFNVAVALVAFMGGALMKTIWDNLKALRADMQRLADTVSDHSQVSHETFMRRDDFSAAVIRLEHAMNRGFDRLEARLDGKVDKP